MVKDHGEVISVSWVPSVSYTESVGHYGARVLMADAVFADLCAERSDAHLCMVTMRLTLSVTPINS